MLLEVKDLNISLTSEKSVAEHISFRLGQGEMLSIVGSSGAGKTTICKAIMGEFMRTMWSNNTVSRCIELPDGRVVKPNEAIRWLDEQEAKDEQTEEAQNEQTN